MTDTIVQGTFTSEIPLVDRETELIRAGLSGITSSVHAASAYASQYGGLIDTTTGEIVRGLEASATVLATTEPEILATHIWTAADEVRNMSRQAIVARVNGMQSPKPSDSEAVPTQSELDADVVARMDAIIDQAILNLGFSLSEKAELLSTTVLTSGERLEELVKSRRVGAVTKAVRWLRSDEKAKRQQELNANVPIKDDTGERNIRKQSAALTGLADDLVSPDSTGLISRIAEQAKEGINTIANELLASRRTSSVQTLGSQAIGRPDVAAAAPISKKQKRRAEKAAVAASQELAPQSDEIETQEPILVGEFETGLPWMGDQKIRLKSKVDNQGRTLYFADAVPTGQLSTFSEKLRTDPATATTLDGLKDKIMQIYQAGEQFNSPDIRTIDRDRESDYSGFNITYVRSYKGNGLRAYFVNTRAKTLGLVGQTGAIEPEAQVLLFVGECTKSNQKAMLDNFGAYI